MGFTRSRLVHLALVAALGAGSAAAQDWDAVEVEAIPVAPEIYMLTGRGGNIGVAVGEDGVILIDDQYAPLTAKIRAAVSRLDDDPIRFVLNTHWHGDHTGGNEALGRVGSVIVAHDNVRRRMSVEQFMEQFDRRVPPAPVGALPIVTFSETVTFHIDDETVHVFHVPHAHTDGDSIVHFVDANVIHMGDVMFNGMYPFIDMSSGGNVEGIIAAAERVLPLCDGKTAIIPGHGPLADREALETYHHVLKSVRDRVAAMVDEGKSLEQIQAAKPSAEFDENWGGGFIAPDLFVQFVHDSLGK
jgi:glyoxylase-like metal-dependent hydrolase (beta-lactamase superfamily II)